MKKKNLTTKISVTALAALLSAGCTVTTVPPFAGPVIVRAEEQVSSSSATVIDENTIWKYLDNNTDPAAGLNSLTAWTSKDFDDTTWKSAAGKFGAKRGELASCGGDCTPTVLLQQYIENTTTDIPTFFFRTTFNVENLDQLTSISGTLFHDDAVAGLKAPEAFIKNLASLALRKMFYKKNCCTNSNWYNSFFNTYLLIC